jgi:hypothetical protein
MVRAEGIMRFVIIGACVFAAASGLAARRASPQIPQTYTNLQVLPKDITPKALVDVMRSFAIELGTRCEHCHVGAGNDLSTFDFASDAKPEKATARKMIHMITTLQAQYLQNVGDPARLPKVTCYTCHRGALRPLTAPPGGGGAPR